MERCCIFLRINQTPTILIHISRSIFVVCLFLCLEFYFFTCFVLSLKKKRTLSTKVRSSGHCCRSHWTHVQKSPRLKTSRVSEHSVRSTLSGHRRNGGKRRGRVTSYLHLHRHCVLHRPSQHHLRKTVPVSCSSNQHPRRHDAHVQVVFIGDYHLNVSDKSLILFLCH